MLAADAWIICDGPVHQSGRKQVVFVVRGDQNVDVTVYGAKRPLHSGHYGNWAPNPAMLLARLLASMKDDGGRITIAGWYGDVEPLGEAELRAIAEAPAYDDELRSQLGLARTEGGGKSLLELINQPSLNINGISSGDVGTLARNIAKRFAPVPRQNRASAATEQGANKMKRVFTAISSLAFLVTLSLNVCAQLVSHDEVLKVIVAQRAELQRLEDLFLSPAEEDRADYKEFLSQTNTGLIRLLPREVYESEVYKKNRKTLTIRGGGAYYSFSKLTQEYGYGVDLGLEPEYLSVGFGGACYGMIIDLGETSDYPGARSQIMRRRKTNRRPA